VLDEADPFEFFAQMLGGGPAMPPVSTVDLSDLDPPADVVPIAGDSVTPEGLPQDDANVITGDYLPQLPAIDTTVRAIGTKIVPPLVTPYGPVTLPPPLPTDAFVPEHMELDTDGGPPEVNEREPDPIGGLPPDDVLPLDIEPPRMPSDADTPPAPDVVPIAGDSDAPSAAPSGISEEMSSDIADSAEDVASAAQDSTGILAYLVGAMRAHPWLATSLAVLVVALAVALPIGLSGGGSSTPAAAPPATTAAATTESTPPPTAIEAPAVSAADVSIADFSLLAPQGFQFSLQAPASAPPHETVTLVFTGPGLPHSAKVAVAAGHAVPLKYVTSGCGKWTVRVAAIDGTPIASKGNPALENGMTHACG
jgi:hypothetical protein